MFELLPEVELLLLFWVLFAAVESVDWESSSSASSVFCSFVEVSSVVSSAFFAVSDSLGLSEELLLPPSRNAFTSEAVNAEEIST